MLILKRSRTAFSKHISLKFKLNDTSYKNLDICIYSHLFDIRSHNYIFLLPWLHVVIIVGVLYVLYNSGVVKYLNIFGVPVLICSFSVYVSLSGGKA